MPGIYWLAVVLISIVGTLITDNLADNLGLPLETTTIVFARRPRGDLRGLVRERETLSIHTIYTPTPRSLLLAGDPVHLRARHRGR